VSKPAFYQLEKNQDLQSVRVETLLELLQLELVVLPHGLYLIAKACLPDRESQILHLVQLDALGW